MKRLVYTSITCSALLANPVFAQTSEDVREAQMFGEPEVKPDADAQAVTPTAESEREADMFGGAVETPEQAPATEPSSRDEAMLGSRTAESDAVAKLLAADDPLAIGGQVFLRANYAVLDEGDLQDFTLSTPNLVDLYLDGRPGDRVRFYTRARLSYDPTVNENTTNVFGGTGQKTRISLDQLWLKFDVESRVFVTVGKQRIKWGTGRFWNPTDFLNTETLDPLNVAVFDERLGVSLLKLHLPVESIGANFYLIGTLDDAARPADVGAALRAEFVVGTNEITASAAVRNNNPLRLGADFNGALGPLDVKLEAALRHGVTTPFYRGSYDTSPLTVDEFDLTGVAFEDIPAAIEAQLPAVLAARLPQGYSREDDWIPQVVAGVEYGVNYTEDDAVYFGAEYFYNGAGYKDADLAALIAVGAFSPFYTGVHYAGAYASLPSPGDWDDTSFSLSGFGNLSDTSFISRIDYSYRFATYLTFNAYVQSHFGKQGEFNYAYAQGPLVDPALIASLTPEQRAGLPPAVVDGVNVIGPLVDLGVGLRTSF